jgi:flagellar L-ring protein precursor FlgH
MVKDLPPEERMVPQDGYIQNNMVPDLQGVPDLEVYRSQRPNSLDYTGPLSIGDPGVTSSLWRASMRRNNLFQDDRAWQPYDLVTIIIEENTQGQKEADTEIITTSSVLAAIENFLGFEADVTQSNPDIDLANLINATSTSNYRGEGDTSRRGTMQARLSAMVVEVLPGGVLRIEGEKIISINNEEEVLVISGLVRPRDVNSNNEVSSVKVAQMRVDLFGKGAVASAQTGGWLGNIFRSFWPF